MGAFSFDAPVVTFLALDNAPTVGGSLITITGMNMGTELSETNQVDISVAGNECSSSAFISASSVTCVSPAGKGSGLDVKITINSIPGVLPGKFSYDARFVSPATGSEYVITVGETLNVFLVGKGEDFSTSIVLSKFQNKDTGMAGNLDPYFSGYPATLTKLKQNSKDPSASFTWAPAEEGEWTACFQLLNSDVVEVDTTCVTIRALMCQHQVVAGDSKESIEDRYQIAWKNVFLLNKEMGTMDDVEPGDIINIGKKIVLPIGKNLEWMVENYGASWYQLALTNPRKVVQVDTESVGALTSYGDYKTTKANEGKTFCIVPSVDIIPTR